MADSKVIQDIMDNLQDTSETLMKVAADVATQAEALAEHNTSPTSHPYLLQKIDDLDAVSMADLNDAISEHANSQSAHANLITKINTEVATNLNEAVSNHNTSSTSHPDLRNAITTLNTLLPYKPFIEQLDDFFGGTSGSVNIPAIEGMNTRLNTVESTLNGHGTRISALEPRVSNLESSQIVQDHRLDNLEDTVADHTLEITNIKTRLTLVEGKLVGVGSTDPNMLTLVHDLPAYVKAGTTYNVKFSGVVVPSGQTLSLSLENIPSGITFSKLVGIAQNETITATIGSSVAPNTQLTFGLRGTLSPSGDNNSINITTTVAILPNLDNFIVNGIGATSIAGTAYPYNFTGGTDPQGSALTYSVVSCSSGTCTIDSVNKKGVFTPASNAVRGSTVSIVFRATSAYGYTDKTITTIIANDINVANLISNHAAVHKPGTVASIVLSGATSSAGGIKYAIAAKAGSVLTFSPNDTITDGSPISMTIPANASRGSIQTFVVTVTDSNGVTATKEFTLKVNSLPVAANIVVSGAPANAKSGTALTLSFTGGSDADGQAVQYSISNISRAGVSFSKTSGIAAGENITVTLDYVSIDTTFTFDVKAIDALGETSADAKSVSILMTPAYVATTPEITYPAEGAVLTSDTVTFVFSELVVNTTAA